MDAERSLSSVSSLLGPILMEVVVMLRPMVFGRSAAAAPRRDSSSALKLGMGIVVVARPEDPVDLAAFTSSCLSSVAVVSSGFAAIFNATRP